MHYTIYRITNKINGKTYVGMHQTKNLDDGYMGSGKLIRRAIAKHGLSNFTKEILHTFDNEEEMKAKEKELVVLGESSYNLCDGGKGGFGYINREKLGGFLGRKHTEISLKRKSISAKKYLETKENFRILSERAKDNLNKYRCDWKGRKHKAETIEKMSKSATDITGSKNPNFGKCWITNNKENKSIPKEDLDKWIELGYRRGRIMDR